jgi:transposase
MQKPSDSKRQQLAENGTLNPHPHKVRDPLFQSHEFFDPNDGLQVKYEMLRRVRIEGWSVSQAAKMFGISRLSFYHTNDAFEREGLGGLLPKKRGPKQAHKLSEEVMGYVTALIQKETLLNTRQLTERIRQRFGFSIHRRSLERALRREKKRR